MKTTITTNQTCSIGSRFETTNRWSSLDRVTSSWLRGGSRFRGRHEMSFRLSASSGFNDEALQKGLEFQLKQSKEKSKSKPKTRSDVPKQMQRPKRKDSDLESTKTQKELASRVEEMSKEQVKQAIARQVGATRADWNDAANSDEETSKAELSKPSAAEEEPKPSSEPGSETIPTPSPSSVILDYPSFSEGMNEGNAATSKTLCGWFCFIYCRAIPIEDGII